MLSRISVWGCIVFLIFSSRRGAFACLWDSINGKRAPFKSNPWLWVISFRRLELTATANLLAPSMQKWAAHRRLLPTLTAQSYETNRGGSAGRTGPVRPSINTLAGGPLNPTWCEWFMGFPEDWTALDEEPSATPSSRSARK